MDTDKAQEFVTKLDALVDSSKAFFAVAALEHFKAMPQDAAAFAALAIDGGARPGRRINFGDKAGLEVGYEYKGQWHPFFSWDPVQGLQAVH